MKILIVPDSFKGSLCSYEVCTCIEKGIRESDKNAEITALPFADGGEGFGKCLSDACNGNILYASCTNIYGKAIKGHYYTFDKTAIIECATASGIQKKKDVMNATSYGTGKLIKDAVSKGFHKIILGLGGSGCCDGGAGALSALGAVFRNIYGEIIEHPCGRDLIDIYSFSCVNIVKGIDFTYACDVENPYYGKNGAAYVFATQKGAKEKDIEILDNGLKMINAFLPNDIGKIKGAGAAGGICGGLYSVYKGKIKSGFEILSQAYKLEEKIKEADIVVTGEGKTDKQTLMGKLPFRISELCRHYGKKCVVISGSIENVSLGDKMISLTDEHTGIKEAMENSAQILTDKSKFILQ